MNSVQNTSTDWFILHGLNMPFSFMCFFLLEKSWEDETLPIRIKSKTLEFWIYVFKIFTSNWRQTKRSRSKILNISIGLHVVEHVSMKFLVSQFMISVMNLRGICNLRIRPYIQWKHIWCQSNKSWLYSFTN